MGCSLADIKKRKNDPLPLCLFSPPPWSNGFKRTVTYFVTYNFFLFYPLKIGLKKYPFISLFFSECGLPELDLSTLHPHIPYVADICFALPCLPCATENPVKQGPCYSHFREPCRALASPQLALVWSSDLWPNWYECSNNPAKLESLPKPFHRCDDRMSEGLSGIVKGIQ